MWNSHWPVWVYRGMKYIRRLTKICSEIWEGSLVWDGWNCDGFRLSALSDQRVRGNGQEQKNGFMGMFPGGALANLGSQEQGDTACQVA